MRYHLRYHLSPKLPVLAGEGGRHLGLWLSVQLAVQLHAPNGLSNVAAQVAPEALVRGVPAAFELIAHGAQLGRELGHDGSHVGAGHGLSHGALTPRRLHSARHFDSSSALTVAFLMRPQSLEKKGRHLWEQAMKR